MANQSTVGSMLLSVRANVTISYCVSNHGLSKVTLEGSVCLQVLFLFSEHLRLSLKIMMKKMAYYYYYSLSFYILPHLILVLSLIRNIIFYFSTLRSLFLLYFSFAVPNLEVTSVVRNSIRSTGSEKFDSIPRKLVALCYNRLFSPDRNDCGYANASQFLSLRTLRERRKKFDAIAVINIFHGL